MIIVMKQAASEEDIEKVKSKVANKAKPQKRNNKGLNFHKDNLASTNCDSPKWKAERTRKNTKLSIGK